MDIYIPTYNRVSTQTTWTALTPDLQARTRLVCNEREAPLHLARKRNVLVHPPYITTIAAKRAWIVEQCRVEKLVMLDDDLRFFGRIVTPAGLRLSADLGKGAALDLCFTTLDALLEDHAHVGISHRLGNQTCEDDVRCPGRMMYVLGYHVPTWKQVVVPNRVEIREDFDYTLQLLRAGYPNAILFKWAVQDAGYGAQAGGEAETRRVEFSNAQAELLAELHPGFVAVRQKDYKQSIPRKEVTIAWQKALSSGISNGLRLGV